MNCEKITCPFNVNRKCLDQMVEEDASHLPKRQAEKILAANQSQTAECALKEFAKGIDQITQIFSQNPTI